MLEEASHLLPLKETNFDLKNEDSVKSQTEPNCTDDNLDRCKCNASTKCSSSVEKDVDLNCECSCNKQTSIINKQSLLDSDLVNSLDLKSVKERHMSVDSARDSGIGDNSNFTDLETKYDDTSDENPEMGDYNSCSNKDDFLPEPTNISNDEDKTNTYLESTTTSDLKGFWQPKIKKSLAERLPPKSFYLVKPSRYIFPGAEIYYDPDEKFGFYEGSSSSGNSESESEAEPGEPVSN